MEDGDLVQRELFEVVFLVFVFESQLVPHEREDLCVELGVTFVARRAGQTVEIAVRLQRKSDDARTTNEQ